MKIIYANKRLYMYQFANHKDEHIAGILLAKNEKEAECILRELPNDYTYGMKERSLINEEVRFSEQNHCTVFYG